MKRHVQAALRSGLICPGAGQLYLGRRWRALGFALPAVAAVVVILADLVGSMVAVSHDLLLQLFDGRMPDIGIFMARVHQLSLDGAAANKPALFVIGGLWAASIIDAWLLGR